MSEDPVHLGDRPNRRVADQLRPVGWKSGEKVFQGLGTLKSLAALEIDPAARVVGVGIALDVRELEAILKAVLAHQIRDIILKIEIWVGACYQGTAAAATQLSLAKTGNDDTGKPTRTGDACVDGVTLPIGEDIGVAGDEEKA